MKKILIVISVFILAITGNLFAQQIPYFSQYKITSPSINPAITGNNGMSYFNLISRQQWAGFNKNRGTPKTSMLSFQHRFPGSQIDVSSGLFGNKMIQKQQQGRVGIGGTIFNDRNGVVHNNGAQMAYAYYIPLGPDQFSFGLATSVFALYTDKGDLHFMNQEEEPAFNTLKPSFFFDVSIGVFYSSSTNFFAGISSKQMLQSAALGDNHYLNEVPRHYYVITGYRFEVNSQIAMEPSVFFRANAESAIQADFNTRLYFEGDYWTGLSYRTNNDLVLLFGINLSQFYVAYSFDYGFSEVIKASFGSHEINLGYSIQ